MGSLVVTGALGGRADGGAPADGRKPDDLGAARVGRVTVRALGTGAGEESAAAGAAGGAGTELSTDGASALALTLGGGETRAFGSGVGVPVLLSASKTPPTTHAPTTPNASHRPRRLSGSRTEEPDEVSTVTGASF